MGRDGMRTDHPPALPELDQQRGHVKDFILSEECLNSRSKKQQNYKSFAAKSLSHEAIKGASKNSIMACLKPAIAYNLAG
jgi:hypothetical protein